MLSNTARITECRYAISGKTPNRSRSGLARKLAIAAGVVKGGCAIR